MADWRQTHGGNPAGIQSMNRPPMSKFMKGNLLFAAGEVPMNMAAGDDFGTAALKAGASASLWASAPWVMGAYTVATTLPMAAGSLYSSYLNQKQWWNQQHLNGQIGGNYQDTQRALTMRQASVQAIQGSKMNVRSALGGEAKIISKNWMKG